MSLLKTILLLASAALAAPIVPRPLAHVVGTGLSFYSSNFSTGSALGPGSSYTCYGGPAENFPSIGKWASFNDLWYGDCGNKANVMPDVDR